MTTKIYNCNKDFIKIQIQQQLYWTYRRYTCIIKFDWMIIKICCHQSINWLLLFFSIGSYSHISRDGFVLNYIEDAIYLLYSNFPTLILYINATNYFFLNLESFRQKTLKFVKWFLQNTFFTHFKCEFHFIS